MWGRESPIPFWQIDKFMHSDFIWMERKWEWGYERPYTQIYTNAMRVWLFIGICPKDTTYKAPHHIAVSNIAVHSFDLLSILFGHSNSHYFGCTTTFFSILWRFFFLYRKIDSSIYIRQHSLYSECLPASDGFYVYFFFGVKWFHSLHSFIQNIKHLIVEFTLGMVLEIWCNQYAVDL